MHIQRGNLIRHKTTNGKPIGDWLMVNMANKRYVYATSLKFSKIYSVIILRDRVYVPKIARLCVSVEIFKKLTAGIIYTVTHNPSKTWINITEDDYDLVEFYTQYGGKLFFTIDSANVIKQAGYKTVRVTVGEKVYQQDVF